MLVPGDVIFAGAMLIMLDMTASNALDCGADCLKSLGFSAKVSLAECVGHARECPVTAACTTSVTWQQFRTLQKKVY
jgi:hypothetical protein